MTTLTRSTIEDEKNSVAQLVRAAQSGNPHAYGALVERFEQTVFHTALRRLRDYTEAQELTQDVFIRAFEKIDQLNTPESFGSWLRSITVRMAINRIVRRAPTVSAEPRALEASCIETETPLTLILSAERAVQVRTGMSRLGEMDRKTLEAFYVQGRSLRQMSDEFDAPVGTIKRRLHVARKRLAQKVEGLVTA